MLRREYKTHLRLLDYSHRSYHIITHGDLIFKLPLYKRAVAPYIGFRRLKLNIYDGFQQDYFKFLSRIRDINSIFF